MPAEGEACVLNACGRRKVFFFFKQKTAYEIMPSLVGSEMCIRDRPDITKLGELGTAVNTTSKRGWRCYIAAFRNAIRFEFDGVVVTDVTEGDLRII